MARLADRVLAIEFWLVGALVALTVALPRAQPIALAACATFWLLRRWRTGRFTQSTRADTWIIGLCVMLGVTLWVTILPQTTQPQVWRALLGVALFYAVVNWATTRARLNLIIACVIGAAAVLALSAPWTMEVYKVSKLRLVPEFAYDYFHPLLSDAINPNVLAGALLLALPLTWVASGAKNLRRLISILLIAVVLITQSRGGLMALGAIVLLQLISRLTTRRAQIFVCATVILIGCGVAVWLAQDTALQATFTQISGLDQRRDSWARALNLIQDFMFTGSGRGSFETVSKLFYPLDKTLVDIPHAHNLFLQIAVDLGVLGLIFWLGGLVTTLAACISAMRAGSNDARALAWAILVGQIGMLVHGLTDAVLWGLPRTAPLVWLLWGVAHANKNLMRMNTSGSIQQTGDAAR